MQYFMNVFEAVKGLHYEKKKVLEEIFIEPEERLKSSSSDSNSVCE